MRYLITILGFIFCGLLLSPSLAISQTIDYSYDVHGRLIEVQRTASDTTTYQYDNANNRISIQIGSGPSGGSSDVACTDANVSTSYSGGAWDGLVNCTTTSGVLSIDSITQPINGASTSIVTSNNFISFNNLPIGITVIERTITNGQGSNDTSYFIVNRTSNGGGGWGN